MSKNGERTYKRFTSEKTAKSFASKVEGNVRDLRQHSERKSDFKVDTQETFTGLTQEDMIHQTLTATLMVTVQTGTPLKICKQQHPLAVYKAAVERG